MKRAVRDYLAQQRRVASLFAWGTGAKGECGNGTLHHNAVPVRVTCSEWDASTRFASVACGLRTSLALTASGRVYVWGDAAQRSIGIEPTGDGVVAEPTLCVPLQLAGVTTVALAAGLRHSLFLDSRGVVRASGDNTFGQLGNGAKTASVLPEPVVGGSLAERRVVQLCAGYDHSLALCADGTVHAWGQNEEHQCAGTDAMVTVPTLVRLPARCSLPVRRVMAGADSSAVVDARGLLWVWGSVGHVEPLFPAAASIACAALGSRHVLAVDEDGRVWATDEHATPVSELLESVAVTNGLAVGITRSSRTLVTWGAVGLLGDGRMEVPLESLHAAPHVPDQQTPMAVPLLVGRPAAAMAVGPTHSLVVIEEHA